MANEDERAVPAGASGRTALEVARLCGAEAGAIIRDGFGRVGIARVKGRGNVLTETDLAAEAAVMAVLGREYPGMPVLSEETAAATRSAGWMWVVDPIDGTKNFSRGLPHCAFSIALCFACEPVLAVTTQPPTGWEFATVRGEGAWYNGEATRVAPCTSVREGIVAIDMGYDDGRARRQLALAQHLWPGMQALRVTGSATLGFAYVAAGKWDLYVHSNLEPWDIAAGILLVEEAGGIITDREGRRATLFSQAAVAAGPEVHRDFFALAGELPWQA